MCGTLVYYHCGYRNSSILSPFFDVLMILLFSSAVLGLLFHHTNIWVPVDRLEWQISLDAANSIVAWLANTVGATESVLRVAATGHDKRLFFRVVVCLDILLVIGRLVSGVTVAFAGLCLFCLYTLAENSQSIGACVPQLLRQRNGTNVNCNCSLNIQLGQQIEGSELCLRLGQALFYTMAETVELQ